MFFYFKLQSKQNEAKITNGFKHRPHKPRHDLWPVGTTDIDLGGVLLA